MLSHLSVPKVNLFSFSTLLCRLIPSRKFPSFSFLLKPPASTNFEVFSFFVFQVGTIPKFFEGAFLGPSSARGHTSSIIIMTIIIIIYHLITVPILGIHIYIANILNKQSWTADQESSSSLGVWREANNLTL